MLKTRDTMANDRLKAYLAVCDKQTLGKIIEGWAELCESCSYRYNRACEFGLLPITAEGAKCPYFKDWIGG